MGKGDLQPSLLVRADMTPTSPKSSSNNLYIVMDGTITTNISWYSGMMEYNYGYEHIMAAVV